MSSSFKKWDSEKPNWQNGPVVYLACANRDLLREAERFVLKRWREEGAEVDARIDGPVPDFAMLIAETGAISLFGGTRYVLLRELAPSSLSDKDEKELAELFSDLENAVLLVTALYKDGRAAKSKKAKNLAKKAAEHGFFIELKEPTRRENLELVNDAAALCGAKFAPGAAEDLLERAGVNHSLLQNEAEKLAAISGYQTIEREHVRRFGARNVEADVFELMRFVTAGKNAAAQEKLQELFALKTEPIAITAVLGGNFVDMLRVRVGAESRHNIDTVFAHMNYTGNSWRLQKAKENASRYSTTALKQAVSMLMGVDKALKSTALADKKVLVQAAVADLILLRNVE